MSVSTAKGTSDDDVPKRKKSRPHRLRRRLTIAVVVAVVVIVVAVIASAPVRRLAVVRRGRPADDLLEAPRHRRRRRRRVRGGVLRGRLRQPRDRPAPGAQVPADRGRRRHRGRARAGAALGAARRAAARRCSARSSPAARPSARGCVYARALDCVPFGVRDPIFHHDLSFYVFQLPALGVRLLVPVRRADRRPDRLDRGPLRGRRPRDPHARDGSAHEAPESGAHAAGGARGRARLARQRLRASGEGAVIHISALVGGALHPRRARLPLRGVEPALLDRRRGVRRRLHRRAPAPAR